MTIAEVSIWSDVTFLPRLNWSPVWRILVSQPQANKLCYGEERKISSLPVPVPVRRAGRAPEGKPWNRSSDGRLFANLVSGQLPTIKVS